MINIFNQIDFMGMTIFGLICYLIGLLSAAIIICKLMKLPDPRTIGSGNPGATNILRFASKKVAATTLVGDSLKSFIPIFIIKYLLLPKPEVVAFSAFAAFMGHLYPIYFKFQGGKGVATALGCILAINPFAAVCVLFTWIIIFAVTKISSLSALTAAIFCPLFLWLLNATEIYNSSIYEIVSIMLMDIMLIIRHKENIKRLYYGDETKTR